MMRRLAACAVLAAGLWCAVAVVAEERPRVEQAPLWRLSPEVSFSTFRLGFEPVDDGIAAAGILDAASGGWLKLGYGLFLDDDYYLLVPEHETALRLSGGYASYGAAGSSFDPAGTGAADASYRDYRLGYVDIGIDQVLAGDRRHTGSWLMASLSDESRWVAPSTASGESAAPEPFFAHRPRAALSFSLGPRKGFWAVASLSGSAGAQIEAGHSASRLPWAFAAADASLSFKLPLAGPWLYLSGSGGGTAWLADLAGTAGIPAFYYTAYSSPVSLRVEADLRSRVLRFDPLVPMALDIGIGAGSSAAGGSLSAVDYGTLLNPSLRAYADLSIETVLFGNFRLRTGVGIDPVTFAISPIVSFLSE
jgi:hypothetical protein